MKQQSDRKYKPMTVAQRQKVSRLVSIDMETNGATGLARALGCTRQYVYVMRNEGQVSPEMAVTYSYAMGHKLADLRPDIWFNGG